jgi:hypothetical protein
MASVVISGDTSGAITLSAPSVAGTNTITLPASTGTVLTTGSPQSGGVIQVVNGTTGYLSTTSTSYVDTGLSATITPKFSTSKVLVNINLVGVTCSGTTSWGFQLVNGSNTNLAYLQNYNTSLSGIPSGYSYSFLFSPATTSALTYKIQFVTNAGAIRLSDYSSNSQLSTITLMEIAA